MSFESMILWWLLCAVFGGALGALKTGGQGAAIGVLMSLLLGPIGILIMIFYALFAQSKESTERANSKMCPHCAERVAKAAKRCKHCGGITETIMCPNCQARLYKPDLPTGSVSACSTCQGQFLVP